MSIAVVVGAFSISVRHSFMHFRDQCVNRSYFMYFAFKLSFTAVVPHRSGALSMGFEPSGTEPSGMEPLWQRQDG